MKNENGENGMLSFLGYLLSTDPSELEEMVLGGYNLVLSNGKTIYIKKHSKGISGVYPWMVGDQHFFDEEAAKAWLKTLIAEKLTGKRIVYRFPAKIPEICGVNGKACRAKGSCNTALCMNCPIADQFRANRDGVEIVYAVQAVGGA